MLFFGSQNANNRHCRNFQMITVSSNAMRSSDKRSNSV